MALLAGAGAYRDQLAHAVAEAGVDPRIVESMSGFAGAMPVLAAIVTGGAGLFLLAAAWSVHQGHFAGRIVAWVGAGLALTCNSCAMVSGLTPAFSGAAHVTASSQDATGTHTFAQTVPAGYPMLYRYLSAAIAVWAIIALAVAIVLLATSAANDFFRRVPRLVHWPPPEQHTHQQQSPSAAEMSGEQSPQLATLQRRHQRGELTDEQYAQERSRLLGGTEPDR